MMPNYRVRRMRYRSRTEIISQILDAANGHVNITKTKLMYKAFLSQSQLKEYVKVLTESDLLSYDSASRKFKTTEKGHRFLEIYNKMGNVMREQQQQQPSSTSPFSQELQSQQEQPQLQEQNQGASVSIS
jgi:predicted transcriptional regulator